MNTRRSTNRLNQRLIQLEYSWALSTEKFVHTRKFQVILVAILVFCLILAFIFAQMPIAGETPLIPTYP